MNSNHYNMYKAQDIQDLPRDILQYIYNFIQSEWLALCSKRFWDVYVNSDRMKLCLWYRLQKRKLHLQNVINRKKQTLVEKKPPRYRSFRDVDMYNTIRQTIMNDISWLREDINYIHKRQQTIHGFGVSWSNVFMN